MIHNILFDLDGTLTDPRKGITNCIKYAIKGLGQSYHAELDLTDFIGLPLHTIFKKILNSYDENSISEAISLYRERFSKVGLFENKVYPGIRELLASLYKNSYRLYVVTVKPKVYSERIIRYFFLDQWLVDIVGPKLEEQLDNKIKLVESALVNFTLIPKETVMVGDRKEDIIAGKLNGVVTIGVTYGYGSKEEIVSSAPDHICHRPYDIQSVIMKQ